MLSIYIKVGRIYAVVKSMVPATYRPLLCDSGQIGWRF
jgi:hypothetical protein